MQKSHLPLPPYRAWPVKIPINFYFYFHSLSNTDGTRNFRNIDSCSQSALAGKLVLLSALVATLSCTAVKQPPSKHHNFAYTALLQCAPVPRGKHSPSAGYLNTQASGRIKRKMEGNRLGLI